MLPEKTSQEVTHPKIAPSQARLTLEFSGFGIPKSYVHIGDMGSTIKPFDVLSTLKYRGVTITPSYEHNVLVVIFPESLPR